MIFNIINLICVLTSYLVEFVTSGPVVALELKGSNAIQKWRTLLGPTDSATARNQAPMSVRAKFGTGTLYAQNQLSCCSSLFFLKVEFMG